MDVSTRNGAVAATSVFTALQLGVSAYCAYLRSSRAAGYMRFYAVIPFGFYGGFSIQMSFKQRYQPDGAVSKLGPVWVSQGIHGLLGILLVPWALAGCVIVQKCRKKYLSFDYDWADRGRSSINFYLALVDAFYAACIIVAIVFGARFTPWNYSNCQAYQVYNSWPVTEAGRQGECRRMLTSQIMAVLVILVLAAQFILIVPVAALPSALRAPVFYILRVMRLRRQRHRYRWRRRERAQIVVDEKASLHKAFRDDAIAVTLARHMHFNDVANVSRTSKSMRNAVFRPDADQDGARLDMICEASCGASDSPKRD
ncbi:glycerol-3-phosphate dehydrogenase [Purpureocillium lavendulum]|uniref:Glycerol-3-phosphate dehydrogenase n=1 Tax=Purpureocillium lavendulum TaxID=1247861 RepID=A0AB34G312_9HYPO|nr:glycerol-3-phosphate dehydrogenase [Purpureocillium lavendulum]